MSLVTPREYLFDGDIYTPPPCSSLTESLHCRLSNRAVLRVSGNQVGNRLAVPGDSNSLSVLHFAEKLGQMRLGLGSLYFTHKNINQLI